jgi:hypothetical protein
MGGRQDEPWDNPDRLRVFCGDCAWYGGVQAEGMHLCLHPRARSVQATPVAMLLVLHTATERNAANDCADFQPQSWWQQFRRYRGIEISLLVALWLILFLWLCWWRSGR